MVCYNGSVMSKTIKNKQQNNKMRSAAAGTLVVGALAITMASNHLTDLTQAIDNATPSHDAGNLVQVHQELNKHHHDVHQDIVIDRRQNSSRFDEHKSTTDPDENRENWAFYERGEAA
jgi:hypothetical protein